MLVKKPALRLHKGEIIGFESGHLFFFLQKVILFSIQTLYTALVASIQLCQLDYKHPKSALLGSQQLSWNQSVCQKRLKTKTAQVVRRERKLIHSWMYQSS